MKSNIKRIIIGTILVISSLLLGIIGGIKASSSVTINNSEFDSLINTLKNNWYSEIYYGKDYDEDVLIDQFIGALSTNEKTFLDPYTYLTKIDNSQTTPVKKGKIGVTFTNCFNYPIVSNIEKNGSAYNKLEIGDIVLKVGKKDKDSIKYYSVLDDSINFSNLFDNAIGQANEDLYISVARFNNQNSFDKIDYTLTLNERNEDTYATLVDCNIKDTTMVSLNSFVCQGSNDLSCNQLDSILSNNPSKNLIFDLRNNGGGALASAINICNLFLPEKTLITTLLPKDATMARKYYTENPMKYSYENIFILQNDRTASASEVVISALSYYAKNNNGKGDYNLYLIGDKSYGKGIAQTSTNVLNNAYRLQYTCAKWLRPDNSWIGMKGSKFEKDYQLGFDTTINCEVKKDEILSLMETYSSKKYIYLKNSNFDAYQLDKVSVLNKYLMNLFNKMYGKSYRDDMYFDNTCVDAIKEFQKNYNIEQTGKLDEDTFLYLIKDFYIRKTSFDDSHLQIVNNLLEN